MRAALSLLALTTLALARPGPITSEERAVLRLRRRAGRLRARASPVASAGSPSIASRFIVCPNTNANPGGSLVPLQQAQVQFPDANGAYPNGYLFCGYSNGFCAYDTNGQYQDVGSPGESSSGQCGTVTAQEIGSQPYTRCPSGTGFSPAYSFAQIDGDGPATGPGLICAYNAGGNGLVQCQYDFDTGALQGGYQRSAGLLSPADAQAAGCPTSSVAGGSTEAVTPY